MAANGLPHKNTPGKPETALFLSEVERQAVAFSENNVAIAALKREVEARRTRRRRQLETWRQEEAAVPLKGWARDYNLGSEEGENGRLRKLPYSDGTRHARKGGWMPADRYIVEDHHLDPIDGEMVWVRPALSPVDIRYHVLADSLVWADDAAILRHHHDTP